MLLLVPSSNLNNLNQFFHIVLIYSLLDIQDHTNSDSSLILKKTQSCSSKRLITSLNLEFIPYKQKNSIFQNCLSFY
jgi:hypothetical protein